MFKLAEGEGGNGDDDDDDAGGSGATLLTLAKPHATPSACKASRANPLLPK